MDSAVRASCFVRLGCWHASGTHVRVSLALALALALVSFFFFFLRFVLFCFLGLGNSTKRDLGKDLGMDLETVCGMNG